MNLQELEQILGKDRVQQNKNISPYLTLRTQVTAKYYFEAETREDLKNVGRLKAQNAVPVFLMGGGSNLAITKNLLEGLVVKNMYQKKELLSETEEYANLLVSSGYPMARLASETAKDGYEGLEYQTGLPGTVGGAMYMNSKWTNPLHYCGDHVSHAYVIGENGEIKKVERGYFQFAYDYSILQETKEIVVDVIFKLKKIDPSILIKRSQGALKYRKETQPHGMATAGCFFQNIPEDDKKRLNLPTSSAGNLIDKAGLKNARVGDFVVSEKHANFIINTGNGKPEDLKMLLQMIKTKVLDKFGVNLKEEVVVI